MKHVTFTRDMRPYRPGEMRLVPDDVAAALERDGVIQPNPPAWPPVAADRPADSAPAAQQPLRRPRFPRGRDLLGQTYLTK